MIRVDEIETVGEVDGNKAKQEKSRKKRKRGKIKKEGRKNRE